MAFTWSAMKYFGGLSNISVERLIMPHFLVHPLG